MQVISSNKSSELHILQGHRIWGFSIKSLSKSVFLMEKWKFLGIRWFSIMLLSIVISAIIIVYSNGYDVGVYCFLCKCSPCVLNTCRKLLCTCAPIESGSEASSCLDAIIQMVLRSAKAAHRSKMFRQCCFPITIYLVILNLMMPYGSRFSSSTSIYILQNTDRFYQGNRDEWLFTLMLKGYKRLDEVYLKAWLSSYWKVWFEWVSKSEQSGTGSKPLAALVLFLSFCLISLMILSLSWVYLSTL